LAEIGCGYNKDNYVRGDYNALGYSGKQKRTTGASEKRVTNTDDGRD